MSITNFKKIKKNNKIFKNLTSIDIKQFNKLVEKIEPQDILKKKRKELNIEEE